MKFRPSPDTIHQLYTYLGQRQKVERRIGVDELNRLKDKVKWEPVLPNPFPYPQNMSKDLADQFYCHIRINDHGDPKAPRWEWTQTPMVKLKGYPEVWVKNEAVNKSGTMKDRPAWECVKLYKRLGERILRMEQAGLINGHIQEMPIPVMTDISSGSELTALSHFFQHYGLPPIRVLMDHSRFDAKPDAFMSLYAQIYLADLSASPLDTGQILALTQNPGGISLTSFFGMQPQEVFYDWFSYEVFNFKPDGAPPQFAMHSVYVPYGSGRLMENLLYHQRKASDVRLDGRSARAKRGRADADPQDPGLLNLDDRLEADPFTVSLINIRGAAPLSEESPATMLNATHRPFTIFADRDIDGLLSMGYTGFQSGIERVSDEAIRAGHQALLEGGIPASQTSMNAGAAMGLYLRDLELGLVDRNAPVVIINTGRDVILGAEG